MSAKNQKNLIPLDELKSDTYYNTPLWLDENFLLVSGNAPITASIINNLKTWGYQGVWTEVPTISDESQTAATGDAVTRAVLHNDAEETKGRHQAKAFFGELAYFTLKVYDIFHKEGQLDILAITEEVKKAIQMIKDFRPYMLRLPDLKADGIDYLFTHSARTTIIALTIGDAMKLPNFRIIELGIASILHEIGMMKIPRQVYEKSTELTNTEKKLIATHPTQGFKMLYEYSKENTNPLAREILMGVLQHHERSNGTGYPQRLEGDSISLFGKIIAASCSYDAQISNRPHREGVDGYTSMLMMLKEMRNLYDEKIVTALLNAISIYPLGSHVKLTNGAIGIVVATGDVNPKYPVVKLLITENLQKCKDQSLIQTREKDNLFVTGVLNKQEIDELVAQDLLPG